MLGGGRGGAGAGGGRGGGGPASKRASFPPPPPPNRPASRLSQPGGSSNKSSLSSCSNRPSAAGEAGGGVEETFSLVSGRNSNSFAVIVKLVPGLVDELRKVEAGGGAARIKFDPSGVGPSGNVIDVGGKEFKFTWSTEKAELCDIFVEQQSGEDGNGLLLQSGSCCRKMNVQRTLDESTTNHVKMRSVEAERKLKSRKAIVLDHANSLMKNQLKEMAAAESSPWKLFNQKKASPLKKQKIEAPQAPASTKSTFNSVPASTVAKGRRSSSPRASPPEQSVPISTYGTGSIGKSHHSTEQIVVGQMKSKKSAVIAEKEIPARATAATDTSAHKVSPSVHTGNSNVNQMDLQSALITQLKENPKGMSLKALEKAVGSTFSNSATRMEPILKRIATSHGRGRYFLKPGLDLESIKKLPSEIKSSPDDDHQHELLPQDRHEHALGAKLGEENLALQSEGQAESNSNVLEELNMSMKSDLQHHSPNLFGDKKVFDNCGGQAGSSSNSGSESDSGSESSDSETESGSRSRSRSRSRSKSPVASGSGSSSESESDDSSNSKEGSDEDVDIMTSDDDKEGQNNLAVSEPAFSGSPDAWRLAHATHETQDADAIAGVRIEGHDCNDLEIGGHESGAFEAEKGLLDEDKDIDMVWDESRVHNIEAEVPAELDDGSTMQERETLIGKLFGSNENTPGDSFRHELPDASEKKPKAKSKRGPDVNFDEKSKRVKRGQAESLFADCGSGGMELADSPHNMQIDNNSKGPIIQMNQAGQEANIHLGSQKAYNRTVPREADSEIQQSGKASSDPDMQKKENDKSGRSKHAESSGRGRKSSGKGSQMHEDSQYNKGKSSADPVLVNNFSAEKKLHKKAKESNFGGRKSAPLDSHSKKQDEILGKPIDAVPFLNAHTKSFPADTDPVVKTLHRELSELEQGELREPFEETPVKLQFETNDSCQQSEGKTSMLDHGNSSLSKGKPVVKKASDIAKPSPILSADFKNATERNGKSIPRSRNKVAQPMPQQFTRDDIEAGSQFNKLAESSGKLRQIGAGIKQVIDNDGQGDGFKKALVGVQQSHDSKRGPSHSAKESKTQPSKRINDLVNGRKGTLSEGNNSAPRKRESSSEEDSSSYSKYDKEVPEIKGQIKDFSQYKEYVQEYREKYDSYCTLNKILENYRYEFQNMGKDLESAKGKDMDRYHKILVHLKDSYRRSGPNHKRLKKIFVVLHEELKNLKQRIKDFAVSYK